MYIYKITNIVNNKIYIGLKTSSVNETLDYFGSGRLINKAIDRYGKENFVKEILEENIPNYQLLCEREIYWISYYKSTDRSIGYNITKGGDGFKSNHTQYSKNKIRDFFKGKSYEDIYGDEAELQKLKRKKTTRTPEQYKESGQKISKKLKGVLKGPCRTSECPHCHIIGGSNVMQRWHFENCKTKNN
jgi:group I intron endonuclease